MVTVALVATSSYVVLEKLSPDPPVMIGTDQLSSLTNSNWSLSSSSNVNKIMNITAGHDGFITGKQSNFHSNITETSMSINVLTFENASSSNATYIKLTDSLFNGFSSDFPANSTITNGTVYSYFNEPRNLSRGSSTNFTSMIAVKGTLFTDIIAHGESLSEKFMLNIMLWEINSNSK